MAPLAGWPDTLIDPEAFAREQDRLAPVWTFLGLTGDAPRDGDWFRTTLATRSVFVQRFGDEWRGFENRCAHRSSPLRDGERGNGPIVCPYHAWRYDKDGRAVDIPECRRLFGIDPEEMNAYLTPVELALCGMLIFGRFRKPGDSETLVHFLGDAFPIVAAMSRAPRAPRRIAGTVAANWRLCFHISVEDYHAPTIHPSTFGREGYLNREIIGYFRYGLHSAFFTNSDPAELKDMAAACRDGGWRSRNYRVFHIFPNLTVSHFKADGQFWYIAVLQHAPVAPDRSAMRAWIYPAPFGAARPWHDRWTYWLTEPVRTEIIRRQAARVLREDNVVCEAMQANAARLDPAPLTGRLEERLAWFEESYAAIVGDVADHVG